MINKIIKITAGQIIIWGLACLADMISYAGNGFIQLICIFIVPVCLLVKYVMMWVSMHSYDKKVRLLKWIVQYVIFLAVWLLETYCIVATISKLIETDKWITRNTNLLQNLIYGWWGVLAAIIPAIAVLMHILSIMIKRFNKYQVMQNVVSILLVICVAVAGYFGMNDKYVAERYYASAILVGFACFFFNWCCEKL